MSENVHDLVPELLRSIRDEIRSTNQRIELLREEMHEELGGLRVELNERIDHLRGETREGFVRLTTAISANFATRGDLATLPSRAEMDELRARLEALERRSG